jgi:hypothetical protein
MNRKNSTKPYKVCSKKSKLYSEKQISSLSNKILLTQDKRLKILFKKNHPEFSFGMKSKTKYSDKAIKNALSHANGWVDWLSQNSTLPLVVTKDLSIILMKKTASPTNLTNLMSVIDLGYTVGYPKLHPTTILINMIMYGYILTQNWETFLLTPLGATMLTNAFKGNKKDQEDVLKMLLDASCNGISPTDILSFVPQHNDFCDPNSILKWMLNKGLRRILYEITTRGGCPNHIVTEWNNMIMNISD